MANREELEQDSSIYKRWKSYLYIIPQYLLIVFLLFSGPILTSNPVLILLEIIGFWYLFWVLWTNYVSKFDLAFRPATKARLIAKGPYKFIRHPFSTALVLIFTILITNHVTLARLIAWIALMVVIVLRINYEEKIYSGYFNDYPLYRQRTYKLIPFIY